MNFVSTKRMATLALLLTLPVAACENAFDSESGSVSIHLTDAAGEQVVEAWVTITDIYLQPETGDEDPAADRVYLLQDASETHELVSLANDVADLASKKAVPAGTYGQLRIVITEGCVLTTAQTVYASPGYDRCGTQVDGELVLPSYAGSGVKVLLNGIEVTGGEHSLLLDFDVSQSFGQAVGAADRWVMSPVIRGAEIDLSAAVAVTLDAGDVTLPSGFALGEFSATLHPSTGDSARVTFTDGDNDGVYEIMFQFLMAENGPFDVSLNPPAGLTVTSDPTAPVSVSPASGETAAVDWVLQSASEEEGEVVCPWWICG